MPKLIDYNELWTKLVVFFDAKPEERSNFVEKLHSEITSGFDTITKISMEEIEKKIQDAELFSQIQELVEAQLAFSVMTGYVAYLFVKDVDPEKEKFKDREKTGKIGEEWTKSQTKNQTKEYLKDIDFVVSMLLEKSTGGRINQILLNHPESKDTPYIDMALIETFLNWSAHQGFVLGLIEHDLNN